MPIPTGVQVAPILAARNLSRVLPDGRALVDDVTFDVAPGEVIAVVGGSGSGKSSLFRLLNRLDEPTGGTVLLEGVDYTTIAPGELRRRVGMVLQTPALFPGTVAENVTFGPRTRGERVPPERVAGLLASVDLAGCEDRDVGRLSGGEAQRVSLIRTLINQPDVLLLDEPTSALDDESEQCVERLLRQMKAERSLTALIVTHDLAQAERLAGRVLVLDEGKLARLGPVAEVLRNGVVERLASAA